MDGARDRRWGRAVMCVHAIIVQINNPTQSSTQSNCSAVVVTVSSASGVSDSDITHFKMFNDGRNGGQV